MDINSLYPSNYLKAADVPAPRIFTIKAITVEEIGDDRSKKPVLFFIEETRGLVLNKTNGSMLAHFYGSETDTWLGKQVELFSEPVSFQGRIVNAIRVRAPQQPVAPVNPAPIAPAATPQAAIPAQPVQPAALQQPAPIAPPVAVQQPVPAAPVVAQPQAAPAPVPVAAQQGFADLDDVDY